MLQIYMGDGKGKTTAAVGQAVRAAGAGFKVIYARFMKSRASGEIDILEELKEVDVLTLKGNYPFFKEMTENEKTSVSAEHNAMVDKIKELFYEYQKDGFKVMVVCDEFLHVVKYNLLDNSAIDFICDLSKEAEVIITGREITDDRLKESADYITDMKSIRHPYEKGISARKGIEY